MANDPRCCGADACIINADGYCWCGQKWDGIKMCFPLLENTAGNQQDETVLKKTTNPDLPAPASSS